MKCKRESVLLKLIWLNVFFFVSFCLTSTYAKLPYQYGKTITLSGVPKGLCITQEGTVWIALSSTNKVVKIDTLGNELQTLTGFSTPYDVDVDAIGNVYVADRGNKCIKCFSSEGMLLKTLDCGSAVNGVTVAPNGEIHAALLTAVRVFAADTVKREITTLSLDKFREVRKVLFTVSNALFYIDKNTGMLKISDDTTQPAMVEYLIKKRDGVNVYNRLSYAAGNSQGEIFLISNEDISATSEQGVYRFSSVGTLLDTIGLSGISSLSSGFNAPWGVAVDNTDNLYITDGGNNSLKIWYAVDNVAPQVLVNKLQRKSDGTFCWTLKSDENAQVFYTVRAAQSPISTENYLLTQTPLNIQGNTLFRQVPNLPQNDSIVIDFLLQDKKGNKTKVYSSNKVSTAVKIYTDIDLIRHRMLENLLGSDTMDYKQPVMAERYAALLSLFGTAHVQAQSYVVSENMTSLNLDGTSQTADITLMRNLLEKGLMPLALSYQLLGPVESPNPYYQNAEILDEILNLYRYMQARGVQQGCVFPFSGGGIYLRFTGFFYASLLMREELAEAGLLEYACQMMEWATRWVSPDDDEWGAHVLNNTGKTDGIRTLYNNRLLYLLTLPDTTASCPTDMAYLTQALNNNLKLGSAWNGFLKPDYSAYHHLGVWGNAYVNDALHIGAQVAHLLHGTAYALNTESTENLANGLIAMAQYSAKYDVSRGLCGRFPNNLTPLYQHVSAYAQIMDALPDDSLKNEVQQWFNYLYDPEYTPLKQKFIQNVACDITFYGGLGVMELCRKYKVKNTLSNFSCNRTFPYAAMQIHRRDNWLVTLKGYSKYVWDFETNGGENWYGRHQAHGSMAIYNGADADGVVTAAASGVGYNGYDWTHVSGTTTFNMPLTDMLAEAQAFQWAKFSPEGLVGGVSQNNNGLFAMKYADIRQAYDYKNGRAWLGIKLRANKSYFCFDNMLVCLGSDITNTHANYDAHTTLFQNTLPSAQTPIRLNGAELTELNYTYDQSTQEAAFLTDVAGNTYYIPNASGLHVQRQLQTSMNDKATAVTNGNYATAWLNHGKTTDGSYEYAVWINGLSTADFTKADYYAVECCDATAHIVKYRPTGEKAYVVFSTEKELNDNYIKSVSVPSLLMVAPLENNQIQLSVANPELGFYDQTSFPYQVWSVPATKQYMNAEIQPVTLNLKGNWKIVVSNKQVIFEGYNKLVDETTIRFDGKNAETLSVTLKNQNSTGIETILPEKMQVYPNPTNGQITLSNLSDDTMKILLFDLCGREILSVDCAGQRELKLNLDMLNSGIYQLKKGTDRVRIIKK